jgi:hypothetical protein
MNKDEWQKLLGILSKAHSDFKEAYPVYERGKNKKIRDEARKKMDSAMSTANHFIFESWESFELLTGGEGVHPQTRGTVYEEFKRINYFEGDLQSLLQKIRGKISTM